MNRCKDLFVHENILIVVPLKYCEIPVKNQINPMINGQVRLSIWTEIDLVKVVQSCMFKRF